MLENIKDFILICYYNFRFYLVILQIQYLRFILVIAIIFNCKIKDAIALSLALALYFGVCIYKTIKLL